MLKLLQKIGRIAVEVFYPHAAACLCCMEPRRVSTYDSLCDACREKLKPLRIPAEACDRCLMPVAQGKRCAFCASSVMRNIKRVYAPFRYADEARTIIHRFKFGYNDDALPILIDNMESALTNRDFDCIVPVPMHRLRLMDKGSNQTEVLAAALSQRTGIPVYLPLERIRFRTPQSKTSHENRKRNVENAFRCKGDVNGLRLLLLDDVRTTGHTVSECAKTLMKGGAESVSLCVCAIVYRNILKNERIKRERERALDRLY